jgi:aminoglycoside 3-N-acetyltransferase
MNRYSCQDVTRAMIEAGVGRGDTVYLSTQLYGIGMLTGARNAADLAAGFVAGVRDAIGPSGTIVVPTFTQQVGRYGVPYIHEETPSLTGIVGEYLRSRPDASRSLHPVFSVTAQGPNAQTITSDISTVAFGHDSVFDRLYKLGSKCVCAGFDFYSGHITSLMHYVETSFAVPYYYNKIVASKVFAGGKLVDKLFTINVKHLGINCVFDYRRYIDRIAETGQLRAAKLGGGHVYCVDTRQQIDTGFELLKRDIHAFLARPPEYAFGRIPFEGPPEPRTESPEKQTNWVGFLIGVR